MTSRYLEELVTRAKFKLVTSQLKSSGCDTVSFSEWFRTYRRIILPLSYYVMQTNWSVPSKRREWLTQRHSMPSNKTSVSSNWVLPLWQHPTYQKWNSVCATPAPTWERHRTTRSVLSMTRHDKEALRTTLDNRLDITHFFLVHLS
jgi:hypothetical protein